MGLQDPIVQEDVNNLMSIKKKLNLPLTKLAMVQRIQKNKKLSDEEKVKKILNIPKTVSVKEFLNQKLTPSEIVTIGKFVNLNNIK